MFGRNNAEAGKTDSGTVSNMQVNACTDKHTTSATVLAFAVLDETCGVGSVEVIAVNVRRTVHVTVVVADVHVCIHDALVEVDVKA